MRILSRLSLSKTRDREPITRKTTFAVEPVTVVVILLTVGWMIFGSGGSGAY